MKIVPRQYQEMAIVAALVGLLGSLARALVVLATGLGKTLTAALIAKRMKAKKILFLVHNNHILQHAMEEFGLVFDEKTRMSVYNGLSKNGAAEADIVFATWQTMGCNLKKWKKNHFDLIIVDEAHHAEADTYRPTLKYFIGAKLGITATPDRADEDEDIRDVFGPEVINISLEEAIARRWLPDVEYHVVTDESLDEHALQRIASEIREGKKRFTMAEVNRRIFIKKRDEEIARIINGYNEKAVVFCASIGHAERLAKSLDLGATFHSEKGKTGAKTWRLNQKVLSDLKNGIIRRVCAVNAFNEGVNVPSVGLVAFCRVTGSLTIFRQQLGRGLRPGKLKLIVLDFVGNLERIQLLLEMMNRIADLHEKYTPRSELEREGYSRQAFEVSGAGFEFTFSDQIVDLMTVLRHCERNLYTTWQEASAAARRLKLKSKPDYENRYQEDERLTSNPRQKYGGDFPGWPEFLGTAIYKTWQEASVAIQALGVKFEGNLYRGYRKVYKKDLRLPSHPERYYKDFPGWTTFLGEPERVKKYPTWQQAARAAKKLGLKTLISYLKGYKADPRLPASLAIQYKDYPGNPRFFGKK